MQTKYALLDERDIGLVHQYAFEARTEIDKNGCGATIFAYAYKYESGRSSGIYVQDLLWERHCGEIESGFRVVHKNCISVDNRLENLMLVPEALAPRWCQHHTVMAAHSRLMHRGYRGQGIGLAAQRQIQQKMISLHKYSSSSKSSSTSSSSSQVIVTSDEDLARELKLHQCGANAENREQS